MIRVEHGDCRTVMLDLLLEGIQVDAIVCDPPYHLTQNSRGGSARANNPKTPFGRHRLADKGFMGRQWDGGDIAMQPDTWKLCRDLLPAGGHMLVFGGSRTYHRLACAVEDAGLELRDCLMWIYGSGLPKSRALLKPAYEPILLARKPGPLRKLAIDACRVPSAEQWEPSGAPSGGDSVTCYGDGLNNAGRSASHAAGRWPANILHDGSREVLAAFAAYGERGGADKRGQCAGRRPGGFGDVGADRGDGEPNAAVYSDAGTAARFFYSAKASKGDRAGSTHPTIKPVGLVEYLAKLITQPGGLILDPFAGSGTLATAAHRLGMDAILIEREAQYIRDIEARIAGLRPCP